MKTMVNQLQKQVTEMTGSWRNFAQNHLQMSLERGGAAVFRILLIT